MSSRRGIIFITSLVTILVVAMLASVLVAMSHQDLARTSQQKDRQRALELARGGLNRAFHRLTYDAAFQGTLSARYGDLQYTITFDPTAPAAQRSTNRLLDRTASARVGATGEQVFPGFVEVIVVAQAGRATIRLRGLSTQGFSFDRGLGTAGKVRLEGTSVELDGIDNISDHNPQGGGIYSETTGASDAIYFGAGTSVTMTSQCRLEVPGALSSVSGLPPAYNMQVSQPSARPATIPEFDVHKMVVNRTTAPAPREMTNLAGTYYLPYSNISDERYVGGDLVVNGDLNLSEGSLYVKGKLTVNGGILGSGSVFSDGNVEIKGGTSILQTHQSNGAALFSSGNVHMEGLDAAGYLSSLMAAYPGGGAKSIGNSYASYKTNFDNFVTQAQVPISVAQPVAGSNQIQATRTALATLVGSSRGQGSDYFICPVPAPDGTRSAMNGNQPIPRLLTAIKREMGSNFATDPKAQRIVQALEEQSYVVRAQAMVTNVTALEIGPDYKVLSMLDAEPANPRVRVNTGTGGWDDSSLLPDQDNQYPVMSQWTSENFLERYSNYFADLGLDHQMRALTGGDGGAQRPLISPSTFSSSSARQAYQKMVATFANQNKAFADKHASDLSWLSKGNFQGLVYAQGKVQVDGDFRVVGALLARDDIRLNGKTSLIYNHEYFKSRGTSGPLTVINVQEF